MNDPFIIERAIELEGGELKLDGMTVEQLDALTFGGTVVLAQPTGRADAPGIRLFVAYADGTMRELGLFAMRLDEESPWQTFAMLSDCTEQPTATGNFPFGHGPIQDRGDGTGRKDTQRRREWA